MPFEDFLEINCPEPPPGRRSGHAGGRNTLISALRKWHSPHVHILSSSIKFAIAGEIDIETNKGKYRLNSKRFLILNAWEPYTFTIAPKSVARTFSLFFRSRYLPSLQDTLLHSDAALLERGSGEDLSTQLEFPEIIFHSGSNTVGVRLLALFNAWQKGASQHCLSDRVRDIGEALIGVRSSSLSQVGRIDAVKRSTREELFRRVQGAVIFVRQNYSKDIDLNSVARQVGMAPHHLHRTFRAIHGFTLHRWIVQLRLEEAKRLLEQTEIPIRNICTRVGYSSVPSFTNLFRSRFGRAPSALRLSSRVE